MRDTPAMAKRVVAARVLVLVLAALVVIGSPSGFPMGSGAAQRAGASGPSPWADGLTGAVEEVHDPGIAKEGDRWYVFATGPRLYLRSSTDLVHWEDEGVVFAGGWPAWLAERYPGPDENMWAPDVERIGGLWHLYYSRADFGTQRAAIGVATSPTLDPRSPDYAWTDRGMVVSSESGSEGVTAIDPDLVFDEHGDPWLVWGSFWGGIALAPIDPATGKLVTGASPVTVAKRPRWFDGIEGPNVVFRDGWWWLFTSWGFCCRGLDSRYAVRVGRSRSLEGPYVDQAGRPLLEGGGTLLIGSHANQHGIGHGTVFESEHGWTLAHHYYAVDADGARRLGFTPLAMLDGWPLGVDADVELTDAPAPLVAGSWRVRPYPENADPQQDEPPPTSTLGLRADGTVAGGGGRWWVEGNVVRVEAGSAAGGRLAVLLDAQGDLGLGRDGRTAAVRLERIGPAPGPDPAQVPLPPGPRSDPAPPAAADPVTGSPTYTG
jgi:arabinan endo-1,5-alpha-L-arabinosidase